jgi:hypothetical protein
MRQSLFLHTHIVGEELLYIIGFAFEKRAADVPNEGERRGTGPRAVADQT